jgi:hypothetical protein
LALVSADAITEILGDRMAALRIVAALRRIARRRDHVRIAARLLSDASPVRRFVLNTLSMYALDDAADVLTVAIVPGRRPPEHIPYALLREYPHAHVIAPIYVGDVLDALEGTGPRHRVILVGARYVITLAAPMLPRVFRGVPDEVYL